MNRLPFRQSKTNGQVVGELYRRFQYFRIDDNVVVIAGNRVIKAQCWFVGSFDDRWPFFIGAKTLGTGQVQNTDKSNLESVNGTSGYVAADVDLNGQVQNTDLQFKVIPNIGKGEQF